MQQLRRDLTLAGILMLLPLLLFAPVVLGNKTLIPADILYSFEPYRAAADEQAVDSVQNGLLGDLVLQNYAWKQFLVSAVEARELPLWDPYLFAGHPFLANGQHAALYPLTWLFFIFPIERAFGMFITLQLGLAGISMYIFSRTIGARRHGAFLAGLLFQFSGMLIASAVHPMIVAAASWLPLLLACIDLAVRRAKFFSRQRAMLPWALLGATILGLQILAGHAEITYFTLLVMGAFAAWRLAHNALTQPRAHWKAEVLSPALGLLLMVGLGLGMGAVQMLPLYEVVNSSFRQDAVSLSQVLQWAYPKRRAITFLVPNFFGNPTHHSIQDIFSGETLIAGTNANGNAISTFDWGLKNYVEGAAYLGILSLFLAVLGILKPFHITPHPGKTQKLLQHLKTWLRHPYIPFFSTLALFSLGCVFGTPLYALIYALPFLNQSHAPFRWVFPLTVSVGALAALGASSVAEYRETHGPDSPTPRTRSRPPQARSFWSQVMRVIMFDTAPNVVSVTAVIAIWSGVLLWLGLWGSRLAFSQLEPLVERVFWALANAPNAYPDHRAFYAYLFPWIQNAALFLIGSGIALRVSRCPIYLPEKLLRRPVWEVLAVTILLVDLLAFGKGFNPAVDPDLLAYTPPVVDFLAQDRSTWRFSTFDPHGYGTFTANSGMFYQFQDVRGYDSLFSAQYARYMNWIEPQGELPYNRIAPFKEFSSLDSPLTDMLNVKYIVSQEEIPLPKYELRYQDDSVRVYENLGVMPRAFTLPFSATLSVADVESVGESVLKYDPRFYAIVEQDAAGWSGPGASPRPSSTPTAPGDPTPQTISNYTANEINIEVTIDTPSWLVLSDTYFPGWKAFIRDGEDTEIEVPIARIAGNFRGVYLEESNSVRFKYSPNSVKIGVFISFLSGMGMIFLAVIWTWRMVYRESGEQSTVQRVAKNSVAPIALNLFNRAIEFGFAALMLRILGPANAGDYYYAGNTFLWFDIITNFGLNTYLTRQISRNRQEARRYLLNTTAIRLALSVLALPLLAGFIGARQTLVASISAPASTQAIIALLLLYVGMIPNSISTGLTALFYAYEKAEYPAAITSITTMIRVTLGTLILLNGGGIIGLAGATIVINSITLTILATLAYRSFPELRAAGQPRLQLRGPAERQLRGTMLKESWQLMVNHLLATLFYKIDVTLMEAILGSAKLGFYSIGYKLLDSLNVIPSMFTLALFPVISRQAVENRQNFRSLYQLGIKILVAIALPAALVSTIIAKEMVLVLGGPEYLPGAMTALQIMSWSMPIGWINSLTQYVLIALDQQRYLIRSYLVAFLFTLVSNLLLMPRFDYHASAVLHMFSEFLLLVLFMLGIQRVLGKLNWWQVIGKPLIATLIAAGITLLLYPLSRWLALTGAVLGYLFAAWKVGILTDEERRTLAPLLKRG